MFSDLLNSSNASAGDISTGIETLDKIIREKEKAEELATAAAADADADAVDAADSHASDAAAAAAAAPAATGEVLDQNTEPEPEPDYFSAGPSVTSSPSTETGARQLPADEAKAQAEKYKAQAEEKMDKHNYHEANLNLGRALSLLPEEDIMRGYIHSLLAECFEKSEQPTEVVRECTEALEYKKDNKEFQVKQLMRRARAYEGLANEQVGDKKRNILMKGLNDLKNADEKINRFDITKEKDRFNRLIRDLDAAATPPPMTSVAATPPPMTSVAATLTADANPVAAATPTPVTSATDPNQTDWTRIGMFDDSDSSGDES